LGEFSRPLGWLAIDPNQPERVFSGCATTGEYGPVKTVIQETGDAGASWTNDMEYMYKQYAAGTLLALLATLPDGELQHVAVDPQRPDTLYAVRSEPGVLRSQDGGRTWSVQRSGLDIPLAQTIFAPRTSKWLFVGTPAGLYVSRDGAETWQPGHLVLQFTKNTRRELGGAAFIDAYWRARHYGLLPAAKP
jgi:photosystem II stability/assembly factor-like uncharacterized protein